MSLGVVGQRCISEREPELGLGLVERIDRQHVAVRFPAAAETRIYARGTTVLKRVQFRPGETVRSRQGQALVVESVEETDGLLVYQGQGQEIREDAISDITSVNLPPDRLLAGQTDSADVFTLRLRTLELRARLRGSDVRGFLGGRIDLIPHQLYILHEVAQRQIPRVLLADEVGLGKTIEACLIIQRLLAVGRARRVLVLVPESLVHQWFVELLRRFNLWFSIYDEERCAAIERGRPADNPFLDSQLALVSLDFLTDNEERRAQAVAAGWDVVVVDEAHHLQWDPAEGAGADYALVEQLARQSPGLLLLTATPQQLGAAGHFARLRLLDPSRYHDYAKFQAESERYIAVAAVAGTLLEERPLSAGDEEVLRSLFARQPERIGRQLADLRRGAADARSALLQTLLDQHGPGRVIFRNTRAAMTGFPGRQYRPVPLEADATLVARVSRELEAEEVGTDASIRYQYKEDPRILWLADFLREDPARKVLLICRSQRKVAAIAAALQEVINAKVGLFHEGLPLVQRDRNAAWFAEPEGAQLLLCSEIGSEGRNFQFAHDLVLFDLPLNPGLVEQRIGRLDRIGQQQTIAIHVPYFRGSSLEVVADWYHQGLNAFERSVQGADEYTLAFRAPVLAAALAAGATRADGPDIAALIRQTTTFRQELEERLRRGRDRLLEIHSHRPETSAAVIARVQAADADVDFRRLLYDLLDQFGVRLREHEGGDVFLDPSHAFVHPFPSVPEEGILATFDRRRAIAREDITFLSPDHPLTHDTIDLLLNSPRGTAAFGFIAAPQPNLLLEALLVLESVADARWQVDEFLPPTPVRVLVDVRGKDLTDERDARAIAAEIQDADIHRFLERPGFNAAVLKALVEGAAQCADQRARRLRTEAGQRAESGLRREVQRLRDLSLVNPQVTPEEIDLARERQDQTDRAIRESRLRLDAIRLIIEGPAALRG